MSKKRVSTERKSKQGRTEQILIFLFCAIAAITPLIYFNGVNELFEFPKLMFTYVVSGIILTIFALLRVVNWNFKTFRSKFALPLLLFLAANVVSTLFSMDKYTSIIGYYTRFNGGLISVTIFTLLFFVLLNIKNAGTREKIMNSIYSSSLLVSAYAIAQHFGFQKGYWIEDSQARVFSTLGQPNWLAAYTLLIMFPALNGALKAEGVKKYFYSAVFLTSFASLWFTYSLSGILGFFGAVILLAFYLGRKRIMEDKKFLAGIAGLVILICVLNPGVLGPKLRDTLNDIRRNVASRTVVYANDGTRPTNSSPTGKFGDTTAIRLIVWKGTLNLITSSPKNFLIGTGPETFPYAFPKFRPVELNQSSEWDFIFNKPHNFYLDIFSNLGLFGLATYALLVFRLFKNRGSTENFGLKAGILALMISDSFGWHTVVTSLFLYLYLALISREEESV